MGNFKFDLSTFKTNNIIEASIGKAWVTIYPENQNYDLEISSLLDWECETTFNMIHYTNGKILFYNGSAYPLNGTCFLIENDGTILELIFKSGILLVAEKIESRYQVEDISLPSFKDIDIDKTIVTHNSCKFMSHGNHNILKISAENDGLVIQYESNNREIYIAAITNLHKISIDIENEDSIPFVDGINYCFDNSLEWYVPKESTDETNKNPIIFYKSNNRLENIDINNINTLKINFLNDIK